MNNALAHRILDEMSEVNPRESIKYIYSILHTCFKDVHMGGDSNTERKGSKVIEYSRIVINNISRFSDISYFLLILYCIFEVIKNANDNSLFDLLRNLTGLILFAISLLIFVSFIFDSYHTKKTETKVKNVLKHKRKRVHGSLGYDAFPKNINNNEIDYDSNPRSNTKKILLNVILDKTNLVNFLMVFLIFASLVYNQIFRAILLVRISMIDSKKILRNRFALIYPEITLMLMVSIILILLAYIYSLSELYFNEASFLPTKYTWDD